MKRYSYPRALRNALTASAVLAFACSLNAAKPDAAATDDTMTASPAAKTEQAKKAAPVPGAKPKNAKGAGKRQEARATVAPLKTFRVLAEALGDEPAKKLPPAAADNAVWDQAIADSTAAWAKLMRAQGVVLGQEAKVLYDPESETLSLYANAEAIEMVEVYTEQLCSYAPRHITFTLEVL
ncbi:MAG: hypothetical protein ACAH88_16175, partial [Roseimicrobium sp.]